MNLKIKILIGILTIGIVLISGWWIWSSYYKVSETYCEKLNEEIGEKIKKLDKSCQSNEDCKTVELLRLIQADGAYPLCINKRENIKDIRSLQNLYYKKCKASLPNILITPAPFYGCECKNNVCTEITKEVQGVTLTTDKTEYEEGETVKIILRNNLSKSIWYLNGHTSCTDINKGYRIYQFLNEKWIDVTPPIACPTIKGAGGLIFKELGPNDSVVFTWDLKILDKVKGSTEAPPGKYKFLMFYKEDKKTEKLKEVYSNEFTIKEKHFDTIPPQSLIPCNDKTAEEYFMHGDYKKALECVKRARERYLEINDSLGISKCDILISEINEKIKEK